MAERTPGPEAGDDTGAEPGRVQTGMPGWVKVSLITVAALVVLFVVLALTGVLGGEHGPGRHLPGGGSDHTPPIEHTQ